MKPRVLWEWLVASAVMWALTLLFGYVLVSHVEDHRWWPAVWDALAMVAAMIRGSKWWTRGAR